MATDERWKTWVDGSPVRRWRKQHDLTVMQAATALGCSITTVQSWERGANPTEASMARIAETLDQDPTVLARTWRRWQNRCPMVAA